VQETARRKKENKRRREQNSIALVDKYATVIRSVTAETSPEGTTISQGCMLYLYLTSKHINSNEAADAAFFGLLKRACARTVENIIEVLFFLLSVVFCARCVCGHVVLEMVISLASCTWAPFSPHIACSWYIYTHEHADAHTHNERRREREKATHTHMHTHTRMSARIWCM